MTTTYRRHIGDQVRTSPRVVAAVDVLIDLTGYDSERAFCELLGVAYRTQLDVVDLADALLALMVQTTPDDRSTEAWIVDEVWGRLVQEHQHRFGTVAGESHCSIVDRLATAGLPC